MTHDLFVHAEGRAPYQFAQKVTATGRPCCLYCSKPIPSRYWHAMRDGAIPYFHSDTCARKWAEWIAGRLVHPAGTVKAGP